MATAVHAAVRGSPMQGLSAEELIERGIAPVKAEYWRPALSAASQQQPAGAGGEGGANGAPSSAEAAVQAQKSKRQSKRVGQGWLPLVPSYMYQTCWCWEGWLPGTV